MARQIGQQMRFTDAELSLMKNTFSENEDALFIIRKVMLQFPLDVMEADSLKAIMTKEVKALLRKTFLPDIDPDAPLFQLVDLVLGLSGDYKENGIEKIGPYLESKQIVIDYVAQQLAVLDDPNSEMSISLKELADLKHENAAVRVLSRNYILSFVDSHLQQIKFLAGKKQETVEETKKRLAQDSTK